MLWRWTMINVNAFRFHNLRALRLTLVALIVAASALPVTAGQQADYAVAAVKRLIAAGRIPEDAVLRLVAKEGNLNNFWGDDFDIKNEWEDRTGILLDARARPNLPVLEFMQKVKNFDLTIAWQREYPDLYTKGLIADLTPYVTKHRLDLRPHRAKSFLNPIAQTTFDHRVVAIPADGDVAMLYLRRDLMEDPAHQQAFQRQHNRPLQAPATWDEYQALIEYFHQPEQQFYGTVEHRDPQTSWMPWMPR